MTVGKFKGKVMGTLRVLGIGKLGENNNGRQINICDCSLLVRVFSQLAISEEHIKALSLWHLQHKIWKMPTGLGFYGYGWHPLSFISCGILLLLLFSHLFYFISFAYYMIQKNKGITSIC